MNKYEVIIFWDETDAVYVAEMPELKGCLAHGNTSIEALESVHQVAKEWLELATEKGWEIPAPKGRLLYA